MNAIGSALLPTPDGRWWLTEVRFAAETGAWWISDAVRVDEGPARARLAGGGKWSVRRNRSTGATVRFLAGIGFDQAADELVDRWGAGHCPHGTAGDPLLFDSEQRGPACSEPCAASVGSLFDQPPSQLVDWCADCGIAVAPGSIWPLGGHDDHTTQRVHLTT